MFAHLRCHSPGIHHRRGTGIPPLVAGIGITTGEVVAGNEGGPQRVDYAVIGDTYHAARQALPMEAKAIPPLVVHGKANPVEAFMLN